jgi:hypothetical protein
VRELLNSRIVGKPKETVQRASVPDDIRAIHEMSHHERDQLYAELMAVEGVDLDEPVTTA